MPAIRLDKLLADTGKWSRKEAKELVRQRRVRIDGVHATSPEEKYDPTQVSVQVDGEEIFHQEYTYVMLHKPGGVLSATEDKRQKTVLDLLPKELQRQDLFPVGRLDKDTEGLLLLTNDGELAHRLLSPRHHVDKVYLAQVDGILTAEDQAAFEGGMVLSDGLHCLPAGLELLPELGKDWGKVTLREGKFHQIKRMMEELGKPVVYLKRISMGSLELDGNLEKSEFRLLTDEEQKKMLKNAGLSR
jgi:16S rRNA pseudouridine516 synthase